MAKHINALQFVGLIAHPAAPHFDTCSWRKVMKSTYHSNSNLDLSFTRVIHVPRTLVWRAWTEPEWLKPWFCPLPWKTIACEIDLRPGGIFHTTMQSPEGVEFPNDGCYLEVVTQERLVWTNALLPGFRPGKPCAPADADDAKFLFTAMLELADADQGTRYTATVMHADETGCRQHAAMGFESGWGTALDQLIAMIQLES